MGVISFAAALAKIAGAFALIAAALLPLSRERELLLSPPTRPLFENEKRIQTRQKIVVDRARGFRQTRDDF